MCPKLWCPRCPESGVDRWQGRGRAGRGEDMDPDHLRRFFFLPRGVPVVVVVVVVVDKAHRSEAKRESSGCQGAWARQPSITIKPIHHRSNGIHRPPRDRAANANPSSHTTRFGMIQGNHS
ncbi:hypothetical protein GQ607_001767 [Colletotrichum asianum]|uniref:Uncharacterized protein n=1 Tax=Colletotrichum asianum TaxID=702518 RepID=A0A8H3WMT2_9PEZI|nr:hypothetical protein GQ607_001767 [Colletotrichum asianum]